MGIKDSPRGAHHEPAATTDLARSSQRNGGKAAPAALPAIDAPMLSNYTPHTRSTPQLIDTQLNQSPLSTLPDTNGHPGWADADDDAVEYGRNGEPITNERLQELLDAREIDTVVPSKALRHAVVKNPDTAKHLNVVPVAFRHGELFVDAADAFRDPTVPQRSLDEWTDGREWPGADMENGGDKPVLLARGITVTYSSGDTVSEKQWEAVRERYGHLPVATQHAILGREVHERFDYHGHGMPGDHAVEKLVPPGSINNTERTRRSDAHRLGTRVELKPRTAGSFLGAIPQIMDTSFREVFDPQSPYAGIEEDLIIALYGKDVTKQ